MRSIFIKAFICGTLFGGAIVWIVQDRSRENAEIAITEAIEETASSP